MNKIFTILRKETQIFFNSPVAYVVIVLFLVITGYFFSIPIFINNQASLRPLIELFPLLFLFFVPAITMRLFSEELKSGTIELLFTLPVKQEEILIGKYLSGIVLLSVCIGGTLFYPFILSFFGNLDWGQVAASYIGVLFLGCVFGSVGVFSSALSRNQIISFIISFMICLIFYFLGRAVPFVPPAISGILDYLGIISHFNNFARGIVDSRDLIYYSSVIAFFLYVTLFLLKTKKINRTLAAYYFSSISILLAILVTANLISSYAFIRFDFTENRIYSISGTTKKIIKNLPDKLVIKAYFSKNLPQQYALNRNYLEDLLGEYKTFSNGKIQYDFLDPMEKKETFDYVTALGIKPIALTQIRHDKYEVREGYMAVAFMYGEKNETIPFVKSTLGMEYDITSKIKRLISDNVKTLGFVTGHGEITDLGEVTEYLKTQYNLKYVDFTVEKNIPDDVSALIVNGPHSKFTEKDIFLLDQFLLKDKPVALMLEQFNVDPQTINAQYFDTGFGDFLKHYGLKIVPALVLDPNCKQIAMNNTLGYYSARSVVNYPPYPLITDIDKTNPIIKDIDGLGLLYASPIEIIPGKDTMVQAIMKSSDKSWYDEKLFFLSPYRNFRPEKGDKKGPFNLAVVVKPKEGKTYQSYFSKKAQNEIKGLSSNKGFIKESGSFGRMFVIGNLTFERYETALFLNVINWLSQDEDLIAIRSKESPLRPLKETSTAFKIVFKYASVFLVPLCVIIYGIIRWRIRIKRKNNYKARYA
ncbi:MAG: hypothetical protein A3J83_01410 [Elusimicrobia bacterium RIFOXYA2_FULL_40_6]|nr:MAG: hypothetical protein A3J83_01410 [Elusimicrobia bacterium RIFOXYA2_FULL_40_6]